MRILCLAIWCFFAAACARPSHAMGASDAASLAVEWNETLLDIASEEDGFLTLKGVRAAAMMHIAMHDALSAIDGRYKPYALESAVVNADPVAAAAEAAFRVAIDQYSDQRDALAALRDKWLASVPDGAAKSAGVEAGEAAANAMMQKRAGDGWDGEAEYRWHPMAPGVYAEFNEHSGTPEGFIFGAGWAQAKGFALTSPDQFRAPPPPDIKSDAYMRAYNEVKEVGRFQSMTRTADQTHLALWWKDFAEDSHNRLARDLALRENLDLTQSSRLFALVNMNIFDAYVSVFDNKFFYNHWRPYTAIRWAANDENPDTEPELTWTNTHRHTYAFPSYPSAHGAACAAAMTAFEDVFGDDYAFTMRTPMVDIAGPMSGKIEMHPQERSFDRFSDAAEECGLSRVYLGIHFRYDSVEGIQLGSKVGRNVVDHYLTKSVRD